jgi:hypothetical protein
MHSLEKEVTPTDRLPFFGAGLATDSAPSARVPRGHDEQYLKGGPIAIRIFVR